MSLDPLDTRPRWGEVGIHGVHRSREWDVVVVTDDGPTGGGDEVEAVVTGDEPPGPFAQALAGEIEPPYRLRAVRREGGRWAVAARRVTLAELPHAGEEIVLAVDGPERTLRVDGRPTLDGLAEVEAAAQTRHRSYVLQARRVRGRLWEVRVDPL